MLICIWFNHCPDIQVGWWIWYHPACSTRCGKDGAIQGLRYRVKNLRWGPQTALRTCQRVHGFTCMLRKWKWQLKTTCSYGQQLIIHFNWTVILPNSWHSHESWSCFVPQPAKLGITQRSCIWSDQDPVAAIRAPWLDDLFAGKIDGMNLGLMVKSHSCWWWLQRIFGSTLCICSGGGHLHDFLACIWYPRHGKAKVQWTSTRVAWCYTVVRTIWICYKMFFPFLCCFAFKATKYHSDSTLACNQGTLQTFARRWQSSLMTKKVGTSTQLLGNVLMLQNLPKYVMTGGLHFCILSC